MPNLKKIKTGTLHRTIDISREQIDEDTRTIKDFSFSSETPIERWFGMEILDHSPESVRLGRLNNKAAFLLDHFRDKHIGVVEEAQVADRRGRAAVRFGKSALAETTYQDVLDGTRPKISVGYKIYKMVLEEEVKDGPDIYRVTDWEPYEISSVAIAADDTVGIGRSEKEDNHETVIEERSIKTMPKCEHCERDLKEGASCECQKRSTQASASAASSEVNVTEVRAEARKAELERTKEILTISEQHKCGDLGRQFIESGKPVDEFRDAVLKEVYRAEPVVETNPNIGMTRKEVQRYSIVKAIRTIGDNKPLEGLEREAHDAAAALCKRGAKGFFIPQDVMSAERDLSAGDATKGGYTVGTEVLGGSMIELLRNKPLIARLGARTLTGLVGNIAIPKIAGGGSTYWLSEDEEVSSSDQSFGQLGLTPKRLVGDTAYSKELVMQSSIDVESFVRDDLMRKLAIEKDRAAINGLGSSGEPRGILNTTGIKTVTFGAAPTWAKVVDFETQIAAANADVDMMALLTTPAVRGKMKTTPKVTAQAIYLWEKGAERGVGDVNGYPAHATNQVPGNKVIFGNFADFIFAEWAGIDVVVDPFSLKKKGQIEVTITLYCDMGVRHPVSFCVSTDSGAQ